MEKITYRDVLIEKKYMQLLVADVISRFGDSIDAIAYSWIMYEVSGNASLIAFIMALNYIPTIFLQPFVAVLVERFEKKKVIALTNFCRGVIVICTMLLYMSGNISSIYLMIATLLTSTFEAFCIPASISFVPKIISMDKIITAKALSNSTCTIAQMIGTSIAGSLIAFFGSYFALLIDAITFFASALIVLSIKIKEKPSTTSLTLATYTSDLSAGFKYLKAKKLLIGVICIGMILNAILIPFTSFQSIFIAEYLHLDAQALSALSLAMMFGMFVGSTLTPKLIDRFSVRACIIVSGFFFAPFYFMSYLAPMLSLEVIMIYIIELSAMFVFGIAFGIVNVCFGAVFIKNIDKAYQSRIGGITNSVLTCMCPIMSMLCSILAVFIRINVIFLIVGVADIIFYIIVARIKLFKQL